MRPSFVAIFRRGKYYREAEQVEDMMPTEQPFDAEASENETTFKGPIKQNERFAVAAIGFCMEHSPAFRKAFFNAICHVDGDDELSDDCKIEIEPKDWADLRITSGNYVYVVEAKVGAKLNDARQNPEKKAFWREKPGYGRELIDYTHKHRRFCVFGHQESLDIQGIRRDEIAISQKSWQDLENCWKQQGSLWENKLIEDLFDCFGDMGIANFKHRKLRNMEINSSLADAAKAQVIICTAAEKLGFDRFIRWKTWGTYYNDPSDWAFGVDVKRKASSQLDEIAPIDRTEVAYFGFTTWFPSDDSDTTSKLTIVASCADANVARATCDKMMKIVQGEDMHLEMKHPDSANGKYAEVILTHSVFSDAIKNSDWFVNAFKALGVKVAML